VNTLLQIQRLVTLFTVFMLTWERSFRQGLVVTLFGSVKKVPKEAKIGTF